MFSSKLSPSKPQALEGSASRGSWYHARGDSGPLPELRQMSGCEMNSHIMESEPSLSGLHVCLSEWFVMQIIYAANYVVR